MTSSGQEEDQSVLDKYSRDRRKNGLCWIKKRGKKGGYFLLRKLEGGGQILDSAYSMSLHTRL